MKMPLRLRLFLRWLGLAACLLIVIAFAVSTRRSVHWTSANLEREVGLMLGGVSYAWRPDGWRLEDDSLFASSGGSEGGPFARSPRWIEDGPFAVSPGWSIAESGGIPKLGWWVARPANKAWTGFSFPLWMPLLLLAVPTAVLWYQDRRLTRESIEKWKGRLCPRQPKRMTIGLVVVCCLIHGVAVIPCLMILTELAEFFFVPGGRFSFDGVLSSHTGSKEAALLLGIGSWVARCLVLGTPVWGVIWAWLYVRLLNRLFRSMRPHCCLNCGYDLTGNVSGVCSECGKAVPAEWPEINRQVADNRPAGG